MGSPGMVETVAIGNTFIPIAQSYSLVQPRTAVNGAFSTYYNFRLFQRSLI
jgi:hypothetical protein